MNSTFDVQDDYEKVRISKKELKFLYNNILNSTITKLDLHLPTTKEDPLKTKIYLDIENYLLKSFQNLLKSLLIDGEDLSNEDIITILKVDDNDTNVEPFDYNINDQLRTILNEYDNLVLDLGELKRTLPKRAQDKYFKLVSKIDEEVSETINNINKEVEEAKLKQEGDKEFVEINFNEFNKEYYDYLLRFDQINSKLPNLKMEFDRFNKAIEFLEKNSSL
ncbi:uncharacterized protein KGF55_005067 [Candida pseudojiufengensis]|uniref:uncharacterized protein n=1 Tax=Candida pseudojiufengensis TaxID=497109 RepID=UPI0022259C26|nr:uncharacterized protein KGF55_005067 [Candida pseudojiufengensis]KAI5959835.1 hypothetical protein KGF55_005067 [Candida pseudojiufengensis]